MATILDSDKISTPRCDSNRIIINKGEITTEYKDKIDILNGKDLYRPTYGAYLCNSLPRGPYLQYKFYDQKQQQSDQQEEQQKQLQPKDMGQQRQEKTKFGINNLNLIANENDNYDNNSDSVEKNKNHQQFPNYIHQKNQREQQQQQQQQQHNKRTAMKNENFTLPRAKLISSFSTYCKNATNNDSQSEEYFNFKLNRTVNRSNSNSNYNNNNNGIINNHDNIFNYPFIKVSSSDNNFRTEAAPAAAAAAPTESLLSTSSLSAEGHYESMNAFQLRGIIQNPPDHYHQHQHHHHHHRHRHHYNHQWQQHSKQPNENSNIHNEHNKSQSNPINMNSNIFEIEWKPTSSSSSGSYIGGTDEQKKPHHHNRNFQYKPRERDNGIPRVIRGYQTLPLKLMNASANHHNGDYLKSTTDQQKQIDIKSTGDLKVILRDSCSNPSNENKFLKSNRTMSEIGNAGRTFIDKIHSENFELFSKMKAERIMNGEEAKKINSLDTKKTSSIVNYNNNLYSCENILNEKQSGNEVDGNLRTRCLKNPPRNEIHVNYVTLKDVIKVRGSNGLSELEGWAILCQSVQALQDLFLADTPSTLRILPLVKSSTIQITSRGRIVFNLISIGPLNSSNDLAIKRRTIENNDNDDKNIEHIDLLRLISSSSLANIKDQLSPEYLKNIGRKAFFAESDIEKMWIYSLGTTLSEVIRIPTIETYQDEFGKEQQISDTTSTQRRESFSSSTNTLTYLKIRNTENISNSNYNNCENGAKFIYKETPNYHPVNSLWIPKDDRVHKDNFHLNYVISRMCQQDLHERASLMYLLNVVSLFCRSQQQSKPFSHIVMDIFKEVVYLLSTSNGNSEVDGVEDYKQENFKERISKKHIDQQERICRETDDIKSETDSGRGSTQDEKDTQSSNSSENVFSEKDIQNDNAAISDNQKNELKVLQKKEENLIVIKYDKFGTIGSGHSKRKQNLSSNEQNSKNISEEKVPPVLQVIRRKNKKLSGKINSENYCRRKTIDVNFFDLEKARLEILQQRLESEAGNLPNSNSCDKNMGKVKNIQHLNYDVRKSYSTIGLNKTTSSTELKVRRANEIISFKCPSSMGIEKGPEFITKSSLPPKELCLLNKNHQNNNNRAVINVILLDGQTVRISCNPVTVTASEIFKTVITAENYLENFFLGLCALIGGDFVFLPSELKVHKVAPQNWSNTKLILKSNQVNNVFFTLFLRVKYFLPTLRGLNSLESRHMLYLQLRKSILEKHILCTEDDLIHLGGLALQAEFGNFTENMKYSEYFTISHYLPEGVYHRNKEMGKYLRNSHFRRQELHPKEAEQNFIKYVQRMKEYGFHLYSAIWETDDDKPKDVYVGISLNGLLIFERRNANVEVLNAATQTYSLEQRRQQSPPSSTTSSLSAASVEKPPSLPTSSSSSSTPTTTSPYRRKLYLNVEWIEIENLCFSKHILCIVVRKTESLKAKDNNRIKYKLRMDGKKSYFAFNLASEHHQFYMKLRNSFISLKTVTDELNIPITSPTVCGKDSKKSSTENIIQEYCPKLYVVERENHQRKEVVNTNENSQLPPKPSAPAPTQLLRKSSSQLEIVTGKRELKEEKMPTESCLTKIVTDRYIETETAAEKTPPRTIIAGIGTKSTSTSSSGIFLPENIRKIDKQLKASVVRVRNLKKSMLNDNRLLKLKEKFLKRSKSSAGIECKRKFEERDNEQNELDDAKDKTETSPLPMEGYKMEQQFEKGKLTEIECKQVDVHFKNISTNEKIENENFFLPFNSGKDVNNIFPSTSKDNNCIDAGSNCGNSKNELLFGNIDVGGIHSYNFGTIHNVYNNDSRTYSSIPNEVLLQLTKEENQNRENEHPYYSLHKQASSATPSNTSSPKIFYSPNRNRVKMGTRVFSSQFLNKSYDNIFDRNLLSLPLSHQIGSNHQDDKETEDRSYSHGKEDTQGNFNSKPNIKNQLSFDCNYKSAITAIVINDEKLLNNHNYSKSISLNSLSNCSPAGFNSRNDEDISKQCSPGAYVINSSINSDYGQCSNFLLPSNETVSESLMEKFNNISCPEMPGNDRILTKLTIVKERITDKNAIRAKDALNDDDDSDIDTIKCYTEDAIAINLNTRCLEDSERDKRGYKEVTTSSASTGFVSSSGDCERDPIKYVTFGRSTFEAPVISEVQKKQTELKKTKNVAKNDETGIATSTKKDKINNECTRSDISSLCAPPPDEYMTVTNKRHSENLRRHEKQEEKNKFSRSKEFLKSQKLLFIDDAHNRSEIQNNGKEENNNSKKFPLFKNSKSKVNNEIVNILNQFRKGKEQGVETGLSEKDYNLRRDIEIGNEKEKDKSIRKNNYSTVSTGDDVGGGGTEKSFINQTDMENDLDKFTLGISIVQGSDNNVYVKDLVKNGPGEKSGIQIGDQIITVNGISLLNLPYEESLKILKNSGQIVDLIVLQIVNKCFFAKGMKNYPLTEVESSKENIKEKDFSEKITTRNDTSSLLIPRNSTLAVKEENERKHISNSQCAKDEKHFTEDIRYKTIDDIFHISEHKSIMRPKENQMKSQYARKIETYTTSKFPIRDVKREKNNRNEQAMYHDDDGNEEHFNGKSERGIPHRTANPVISTGIIISSDEQRNSHSKTSSQRSSSTKEKPFTLPAAERMSPSASLSSSLSKCSGTSFQLPSTSGHFLSLGKESHHNLLFLGENNKFKSTTRNTSSNTRKNVYCSLTPSKSMPELPKVVGIIPKRKCEKNSLRSGISLSQSTEGLSKYGHVGKDTLITIHGQSSRKFLGHVKFPVTPLKTIQTSTNQQQLSLLTESDDEQLVFI